METTIYERLEKAAKALADAQQLLAQADHEVAMALAQAEDSDHDLYALHDLNRRMSKALADVRMLPLRQQKEWMGGCAWMSSLASQSRDCIDIGQHRIYKT